MRRGGGYIAIEGPIGVGKTSLAQALGLRIGARIALEDTDSNPFIARFYQDPEKYAFPVQLYFLRHQGRAWAPEEALPPTLLRSLGDQIGVAPEHLEGYAQRDQTRREHLAELLVAFDWRTFGFHVECELSDW